MAGVSDQVMFAFRELRTEGEIDERRQILLHVQAAFTVRAAGVTVLSDPYFNVVEFAAVVAPWMRDPQREFSFRTLDADESDILFWRRDSDRWRIGSIWGASDGVLVGASELFNGITSFIAELKDACLQDLSLDIGKLLE